MYNKCLCKISHGSGSCNEVPFFKGYYVEKKSKGTVISFVLCEGCMRKIDKLKDENALTELVKNKL